MIKGGLPAKCDKPAGCFIPPQQLLSRSFGQVAKGGIPYFP